MLNIIEYKEHLYNAAIKVESKKDLEHFRMGGEKNGIRRYQNLDGSLTPEGRIHYGVGMSREEQAALKKYEDERQAQIDYDRSKSIREMSDEELQMAVARSRLESQFEQNMQNRANNFLQSQVTEQTLNQQLDDLKYQQSRQKAERFMERVERLARFGGNLASAYGKVVDVKGKIEDVRAKRNLADQEQWKAEQQRIKFETDEWNFGKKQSEYNSSLQNRLAAAKADLDEISGEGKQKSKKELKAEMKAAKKNKSMSDDDYDETIKMWEKEAEEARRSGDKVKEYNAKAMAADARSRKGDKNYDSDSKKSSKSDDHEYIRKEGDRYIYSDSTTSKWNSTKESKKSGIMSKIFGKKDREAAEKRENLKAETKRQIKEAANERLGRWNAEHRSEGNNSDRGYDWQSAMVKSYKKEKSDQAWNSVKKNSNGDWVYNTPKAYQSSERNKGFDWSARMKAGYLAKKNDNSVHNTGNWQDNSKYDWSAAMATSSYYNGGKNMSKAALDRAKRRKKGSWNK